MANNSELEEFEFRARAERERGNGASPAIPENSLWDETKRQAGLTARAAANVAASPLTMGGNVLGKAVNAIAGRQVFQPSTETFDKLLTSAGLPEAERPIEQFTQAVARTAPGLALPTSLPAQVLGNAAIGAADAPQGQELSGAGWGAGGGAAGQALGRIAGGIVRPTAEAQVLLDRGIPLTPGQAAGKGSRFGKVEEALTSNPITGAFVNPARQRAVDAWGQQVVERATQGGAKTLEEANKYASQLYDQVVPSLRPTREAVANVQQSLRDAAQNPELNADGQRMLTGLVQKHMDNFGVMDGQGIKKLDSELGYLARKYAAGDPASRTLSSEIYNVQQGLREGLEAGLPPDLQGTLRQANAIYKNLIPINKAASARADEVIAPRALQKAMARQQRTDVTRVRPDDLLDAGVATLPNVVPDSGTAGRLLANGLPALLMGGGVGAHSLGWDTVGTGMMTAGALGSRPGARILTGGYGAKQQALAEALRRATPATARALTNDGT